MTLAAITIAGLSFSWLFPMWSYYLIFQSAYMTTLMLSSPKPKSVILKAIYYTAIGVACISFIFAIPAMYKFNMDFYYTRNFIVYGALAMTIFAIKDNYKRIFPYVFIGFWFIISDVLKMAFSSNQPLVSHIYYNVDPVATHIFHLMLLASIVITSKEVIPIRSYRKRNLFAK